MPVRALVAAALAAVTLTPAVSSAATSAWCDGTEIGTLCVHNPDDVLLDVACPILEGQTLVGIKCAPHVATR